MKKNGISILSTNVVCQVIYQVIYLIICVVIFLGIFLVPNVAGAKNWTIGFLSNVEKELQNGFMRMASQGLYKAKQAHGFKVILETSKDITQESMALAFQKLLDRKPDLIMVCGFQTAVHVYKLAPLYPDMLFLVHDVPIGNMPNVMSTQHAQHEGSFLVGALAGWMTKTGIVGVIGGVDVPPVVAFSVGYREGVLYANPKALVKEEYITRMPDYAGFSSPAKGAELAKKWYAQGMDVIFAVAGMTGNGIIQQAGKEKKYVIGVDVDQDAMAKGYVLTSMIKRLDNTTYSALSQIVTGNFQPGIRYYGLKNGGVSLTEMQFTRHLIPAGILKNLKEIEKKIISGEIKVTDHLKE